MTETDQTGDVATRLGEILDDMAGELGERPTLGEFLEVLGWSVPVRSPALAEGVAPPVTFKARLRPNSTYHSDRESRAGELNDAVFTDTTDVLAGLAERRSATTGEPTPLAELAAAIGAALGADRITFADVRGEDIRGVTAAVPKRPKKAAVGDVLAIPAKNGGFHTAVVLERNSWGTALGVFRGTTVRPVASAAGREAQPRAIHTSDHSIANGEWSVAGHDERLVALFGRPEIYHDPRYALPGQDLGEFGAAERSDGTLRLIDAQEAREVGLQDGIYQQVQWSSSIGGLLDEALEHDRAE